MLDKTDVGGRIYVWSRKPGKPSQGATAAIISSHGDSAFINPTFVRGGNQFDFNLLFYTPHGYMLRDPGLEEVMNGGIKPIEGRPSSMSGQDYVLAKFQGKHDPRFAQGKAEDYDLISSLTPSDDGLNELRRKANGGGSEAGFAQKRLEDLAIKIQTDVITIRNRKSPGGGSIRLSEVLTLLDENGFRYATIHCAFCRGGGVPK
jgi:hypothetical protein